MTTKKFQAQADEIELIMKRLGFTLEEVARKTGLHPRTLKNAALGFSKLGDLRMKMLRDLGTIPVYSAEELTEAASPPYGRPMMRLRYVPGDSWAKAGVAEAYLDKPSDWMRRVPADTDDPQAFGVDIVGDSMAPNYREGETAILTPNHRPQNGDVVVARLRDGGVLMKIYHTVGKLIRLTSYNPAYPPLDFPQEDFEWIYPVDTVIKQVRH
jgi:SOS-response transcriptional repressor LexA